MTRYIFLMRSAVLVLLIVQAGLTGNAQSTKGPALSAEQKFAWCQQIATKGKASAQELKQLRTYLTDESLTIRSMAAKTIAKIGDNSNETIKALRKNLDSVEDSMRWDLNFTDTKDEVTRASAAYALLHLGVPGKQVLKDRVRNAPSVRGRVEAIIALRSSADPKDTLGLSREMTKLFPEMEKIFNPDPVKKADDILKNASFEEKDIFKDWSFYQVNTKGRASFDTQSRRVGSGSIKLTKEGNEGEIYLKSNRTIQIKKDEPYLVRAYFRSDNAPTNSTLQVIFESKDGGLITSGSDKYAGEAQTFMRNSAKGQWIKRTANITSDKDGEYYVRIVLRGDASTVWLDDITVPAINQGLNFFPMEIQVGELAKQAVTKPAIESSAEIKTIDGRSRLLLNGKEIVPSFYHVLGPVGQFGEYKNMEEQANIKLHVVSLDLSDRGSGIGGRPVWPTTDTFDFSTTFERIAYAVASAPNSNFILNINVSWPEDWIQKNPDETWQNIKKQRGYGMSSQQLFKGFADELPAGFKWWPSPFSDKAIADAQKGIHRFINELKQTPYYNRFVGCHIAGGHDGQFNTSGRPDYSPVAQESFRKWLKALYITDKALQQKWNDANVTFATAEVPDYGRRNSSSKSSQLFYDPVTDQRYIDHTQFQSEQGMIIRDRLAQAFKEAMNKPVVGMTWGMGGGRGQGTENIFLKSKNLDILVAQPSYARRLPGYIGGMRNIALNSYAEHGKIIFKEFDFRTWLRNSPEETYAQRLSTTINPEEFTSAFRKELMQMLVNGQGFWMYDIGRTHFRDPEMLHTIAEGVNLYNNYELTNKNIYRPDVAMVYIDESMLWEKRGMNTNNGLTLDGHTNFQIAEAGFSYDNLYINDILNNPTLQKYKMYIFKDSWRVTAEQRKQIIEKLQKDGKTLVWNYASGYIGDDKLSDDYVSQLTKIEVKSNLVSAWPIVRVLDNKNGLAKNINGRLGMGEAVATAMGKGLAFPTVPLGILRFVVKDKQAKTLAVYEDKESAIAIKKFPNWTSVYFGLIGTLDARLLANVAKEAGVHTFTDSGVGNVEFNGNLLSIHCLKNGVNTVSLPQKSRVIDFDSKKELVVGESFNLDMKTGDTRLFVVEPVK